MLTRILFAYSVSCLPLIILLPVEGILYKSIGHNAVRDIEAVVGPVGLFLGLIMSDWIRRFTTKAISIRTIMAFIAFLALAVLLEIRDISSFVRGHEDLVFGVLPPLVPALASEFVFRGSIREQSAEEESVWRRVRWLGSLLAVLIVVLFFAIDLFMFGRLGPYPLF